MTSMTFPTLSWATLLKNHNQQFTTHFTPTTSFGIEWLTESWQDWLAQLKTFIEEQPTLLLAEQKATKEKIARFQWALASRNTLADPVHIKALYAAAQGNSVNDQVKHRYLSHVMRELKGEGHTEHWPVAALIRVGTYLEQGHHYVARLQEALNTISSPRYKFTCWLGGIPTIPAALAGECFAAVTKMKSALKKSQASRLTAILHRLQLGSDADDRTQGDLQLQRIKKLYDLGLLQQKKSPASSQDNTLPKAPLEVLDKTTFSAMVNTLLQEGSGHQRAELLKLRAFSSTGNGENAIPIETTIHEDSLHFSIDPVTPKNQLARFFEKEKPFFDPHRAFDILGINQAARSLKKAVLTPFGEGVTDIVSLLLKDIDAQYAEAEGEKVNRVFSVFLGGHNEELTQYQSRLAHVFNDVVVKTQLDRLERAILNKNVPLCQDIKKAITPLLTHSMIEPKALARFQVLDEREMQGEAVVVSPDVTAPLMPTPVDPVTASLNILSSGGVLPSAKVKCLNVAMQHNRVDEALLLKAQHQLLRDWSRFAFETMSVGPDPLIWIRRAFAIKTLCTESQQWQFKKSLYHTLYHRMHDQKPLTPETVSLFQTLLWQVLNEKELSARLQRLGRHVSVNNGQLSNEYRKRLADAFHEREQQQIRCLARRDHPRRLATITTHLDTLLEQHVSNESHFALFKDLSLRLSEAQHFFLDILLKEGRSEAIILNQYPALVRELIALAARAKQLLDVVDSDDPVKVSTQFSTLERLFDAFKEKYPDCFRAKAISTQGAFHANTTQ
jgi:hypothetical protein